MSPRLDIAVFSRLKGGTWGPPAFISFYQPPDVKADYYKSGLLREIAYRPAVVADDPFRKALRPLFTPRAWTDTFEFDEKGNVFAFSRRRTGTVFADRFSRATGDKILESWSSGTPKKTQPVEYFVNAEGLLDYRDAGDPVLHSLR